MTLRTYIDRAIHDGADFDAVISGCDVQQTFCWQTDMCITDACEAEYRASAFPSSRSARTSSFSAMPFPGAQRAIAARASTGGCFAPDDPIKRPHGPGAKTLRGRAFAAG